MTLYEYGMFGMKLLTAGLILTAVVIIWRGRGRK